MEGQQYRAAQEPIATHHACCITNQCMATQSTFGSTLSPSSGRLNFSPGGPATPASVTSPPSRGASRTPLLSESDEPAGNHRSRIAASSRLSISQIPGPIRSHTASGRRAASVDPRGTATVGQCDVLSDCLVRAAQTEAMGWYAATRRSGIGSPPLHSPSPNASAVDALRSSLNGSEPLPAHAARFALMAPWNNMVPTSAANDIVARTKWLSEANEAAAQALTAQGAEIEWMTEELVSSRSELTGAKRSAKIAQAVAAERERQLEQCRGLLREAEAAASRTATERELERVRHQEDVSRLTREVTLLRSKLKAVTLRADNLEEEALGLTRTNEEQRSRLADESARVSAQLRAEVDAAVSLLAREHAERLSANADIASLASVLASAVDERDRVARSAQAIIDQEAGARRAVVKQRDALSDRADQTAGLVRVLAEAHRSTHAQLKDVEAGVLADRIAADAAKDAVAEALQRRKSAEDSAAEAASRTASASVAAAIAENMRAEAESRAIALQEEAAAAMVQITEVNQHLREQGRIRDTLATQVGLLQREVEDGTSQRANLTELLSSKETELQEAHVNFNRLHQQQVEFKQRLQDLQKAWEHERSVMEEIKSQLREKQERCQQLEQVEAQLTTELAAERATRKAAEVRESALLTRSIKEELTLPSDIHDDSLGCTDETEHQIALLRSRLAELTENGRAEDASEIEALRQLLAEVVKN